MTQITALTQHKDFDDLVEEVRQTYVRQWMKSNTPEERERFHVKIRVLDDVVMMMRNAAAGMGND